MGGWQGHGVTVTLLHNQGNARLKGTARHPAGSSTSGDLKTTTGAPRCPGCRATAERAGLSGKPVGNTDTRLQQAARRQRDLSVSFEIKTFL